MPIDQTDHPGRSDPSDSCAKEGLGFESPIQHWYALRTRSRHEKVTSAYLERRGFEVFLPLVDRIRQWKDRRVHVQFPLFPGYCFIRCGEVKQLEKPNRITVDPNVCLGQPTIRGMRITVSVILKMLASGKSIQEVIEAYPELEVEDVHQATKYAAWVVSDQIHMIPTT